MEPDPQSLPISVDDALVLLVLLRTVSSENDHERPEDVSMLLSRRIEWLEGLLRARYGPAS